MTEPRSHHLNGAGAAEDDAPHARLLLSVLRLPDDPSDYRYPTPSLESAARLITRPMCKKLAREKSTRDTADCDTQQ